MQIFGLDANNELIGWSTAAVILLVFVGLAFLSRFILTAVARLVSRRTKTVLDDMIIKTLVRPVFAALVVGGLWLSLVQIPELSTHLDVVRQIGVIFLIVIAVISVVRVENALLGWYSAEIAPRTGTDTDNRLIPLFRRVGAVFIYILGALIVLDQLNINISPILAGLGIGGLAVALALQPTLSNFLAGTYVMSDAVIHTGDYITLDSGHEGFVEDIGWRSTKLRSWQGNLIIMPNSKLAEATVTDFEKPEKPILFTVDCGVSYDSNLENVEQVALTTALEVMQKYPEGAKDFQPVVRFKHFGDSNVDFAVVLKAVDRGSHFVLKHVFIKELHKRFGDEGIEIQYPTRKLYFAKGQRMPPSELDSD